MLVYIFVGTSLSDRCSGAYSYIEYDGQEFKKSSPVSVSDPDGMDETRLLFLAVYYYLKGCLKKDKVPRKMVFFTDLAVSSGFPDCSDCNTDVVSGILLLEAVLDTEIEIKKVKENLSGVCDIAKGGIGKCRMTS